MRGGADKETKGPMFLGLFWGALSIEPFEVKKQFSVKFQPLLLGFAAFCFGGRGSGEPPKTGGLLGKRAPMRGAMMFILAKGTRRKFLSTMVPLKRAMHAFPPHVAGKISHQGICIEQQVCSCPCYRCIRITAMAGVTELVEPVLVL